VSRHDGSTPDNRSSYFPNAYHVGRRSCPIYGFTIAPSRRGICDRLRRSSIRITISSPSTAPLNGVPVRKPTCRGGCHLVRSIRLSIMTESVEESALRSWLREGGRTPPSDQDLLAEASVAQVSSGAIAGPRCVSKAHIGWAFRVRSWAHRRTTIFGTMKKPRQLRQGRSRGGEHAAACLVALQTSFGIWSGDSIIGACRIRGSLVHRAIGVDTRAGRLGEVTRGLGIDSTPSKGKRRSSDAEGLNMKSSKSKSGSGSG